MGCIHTPFSSFKFLVLSHGSHRSQIMFSDDMIRFMENVENEFSQLFLKS